MFNCTRELVYHVKGKILYKGKLLKNRPAVEQEKLTKIVSKTQQLKFTHITEFLNKYIFNWNLILFTEACNGVKLLHRWMKDANRCPNELK